MNRREAIIAGIAVAAASVASAPSAAAESAQEANPELDQVRTLLRAHDDALYRKGRYHGFGSWRNLVRIR